jgi:redox-sensitive bicupin YhaK (pirin superfamily)
MGCTSHERNRGKHSEFNPNDDQRTKLLQIWVFPNQQNIEPIPTNFFESRRKKNKLQQILSPNAEDEGV